MIGMFYAVLAEHSALAKHYPGYDFFIGHGLTVNARWRNT